MKIIYNYILYVLEKKLKIKIKNKNKNKNKNIIHINIDNSKHDKKKIFNQVFQVL